MSQFNAEAFTQAILAAHRYTVDSNHSSYEKALQAIVAVLGPGGSGAGSTGAALPSSSTPSDALRASPAPAAIRAAPAASSGGAPAPTRSTSAETSQSAPPSSDAPTAASATDAQQLPPAPPQLPPPPPVHTLAGTPLIDSAVLATLESGMPAILPASPSVDASPAAAAAAGGPKRKRAAAGAEAGAGPPQRRRRGAQAMPEDFRAWLKSFKRYLLREHVSAFTGQRLAPVTVNYRVAATKRLLTRAWLPQHKIGELDLEQLELLRQDHDTDRNSMNAITDLMAFLSAKAEGGVKAELDENGGGDDDDVDEEDSEMGAAPIRGPARVARGIRTRTEVPQATRGFVRWLRKLPGKDKVSGSTAYSYQNVVGQLLRKTGSDLRSFQTEEELKSYILLNRAAIESHIPEMRQPYPKERAAWKKMWEYVSGEKIWAEEGNFWSNRAGGEGSGRGGRRAGAPRRRAPRQDFESSDDPDYGEMEDTEEEEDYEGEDEPEEELVMDDRIEDDRLPPIVHDKLPERESRLPLEPPKDDEEDHRRRLMAAAAAVGGLGPLVVTPMPPMPPSNGHLGHAPPLPLSTSFGRPGEVGRLAEATRPMHALISAAAGQRHEQMHATQMVGVPELGKGPELGMPMPISVPRPLNAPVSQKGTQ